MNQQIRIEAVSPSVDDQEPHHTRECAPRIPPDRVGAAPGERSEVHDPPAGARYNWGGHIRMRTDPGIGPARILCVERRSA